jgi:hypothetical protein
MQPFSDFLKDGSTEFDDKYFSAQQVRRDVESIAISRLAEGEHSSKRRRLLD